MIKHIAYSLAKAFPEINVYRENIKKPELPFFDIRRIKSEIYKKIGNCYELYEKYEIKYFHSKDIGETSRELLSGVALKMSEVLEIMEFNSEKLRGYDMNYRIEDGVLQFFLNAKKRLKKDEAYPLIKNLKNNIERK